MGSNHDFGINDIALGSVSVVVAGFGSATLTLTGTIVRPDHRNNQTPFFWPGNCNGNNNNNNNNNNEVEQFIFLNLTAISGVVLPNPPFAIGTTVAINIDYIILVAPIAI